MLKLDLGLACRTAPNSYSEFNSELSPLSIWNDPLPWPSAANLLPGSRTLVTKLSDSRCYRFFPKHSPEYAHASALQQASLMAERPWQTVLRGISGTGLLSNTLCGHAGVAAPCSRGWLLLPLCGSAPASRLCKDVRIEALVLAPGENKVCEAPHANAQR